MAFSVGQVAWRAVRLTALLTIFAAVTIALLFTTHFFATALLSALACCVVAWSLYIHIANADETFVPKPPASEVIGESDYLQALLDTVSSVLIVMDEDGRIALANRAAHKFAGMPVIKLSQISALSRTTADQIRRLAPRRFGNTKAGRWATSIGHSRPLSLVHQ
jgi:PAS domain-containing protein